MQIDIKDGAVAIVFNPDNTCELMRVGVSDDNFDGPNAKWAVIISHYIRDEACCSAIIEWFKAEREKQMAEIMEMFLRDPKDLN